MPNGKGQEFTASVIVYTRSAKPADDDEKEHGYVELGGVTYKNKTFIPKINYKLRLALKDHSDWKKGEVDNVEQIIALGRKFKIITEGKSSGWAVGSHTFKNQNEIREKCEKDEAFLLLLWRSIVNAYGGQIV